MLDGLLRRQRMSLRPCLLERPFPERPTDRAHGTLVLGVPCRWEGPAHILTQRCGCPTELRCPFHPPLRYRHSRKALQAEEDGMFKAYSPCQLQALFVQTPCPRVLARIACHAPEAGECAHDGPRVLRAPSQSQALFQQRSRAPEISLPACRVCQGAEAPGDAEGSTKLAGQGEGLLLQAHRAFVVSPLVGHEPELAQRSTVPLLVTHLPIHIQAFFVQRRRAIVVPLGHGQDTCYLEQVRLR